MLWEKVPRPACSMVSGGFSSGFELNDLGPSPIVKQQLCCGQTKKQVSATWLLLRLRQAGTYCRGGEGGRLLFPLPILLLRVDDNERCRESSVLLPVFWRSYRETLGTGWQLEMCEMLQ